MTGTPDTFDRYAPHIVYRCVIGSRAYGLEHEGSDTDRRGFFLPPADAHWSLGSVPGQIERDDTQEVYWEAEKFLRLALNANPTVLEALFSPIVEHASPIARELLDIRTSLLSKKIAKTFKGYAQDQFRKHCARMLACHARARRPPKWKQAMHLIRILLVGLGALRTGTVTLRVADEHRDRLLAIRSGEMANADLLAWRHELESACDDALADTPLPDEPDRNAANAWLIRARRSVTDP